jgi:hypothetical protein
LTNEDQDAWHELLRSEVETLHEKTDRLYAFAASRTVASVNSWFKRAT